MNKELIEELMQYGMKFSVSLTKDKASAEDLLHTSLVRALSNYSQDIKEPKKWFASIINNTFITEVKRDKVSFDSDTVEKFQIESDSGRSAQDMEQSFDRNILKSVIESCTKGMKKEYGVAITSLYLKEMSIKETAKAMNSTEQQVKNWSRRGLSYIRKKNPKLKEFL